MPYVDLLREWDLSKYIAVFEEEEIDEEAFACLAPEAIVKLITKAGPYSKFMRKYNEWKANSTEISTPKFSNQTEGNTGSTSTIVLKVGENGLLEELDNFEDLSGIIRNEQPVKPTKLPDAAADGSSLNGKDLDIDSGCGTSVAGSSIQPQIKKRKCAHGLSFEQPKQITSRAALKAIIALDIKSVLQREIKSNAVLASYELSGCLVKNDRDVITERLAIEMLKLNYTPTSHEYLEVANKIKEYFQFEDPAVYYCPPTEARKNSTGKLPRKVANLKYWAKKKTVPLPSPTSNDWVKENIIVKTGSKVTTQALLIGSAERTNEKVELAISSLKFRSSDSYPEILTDWSITHPLRCKTLRETRPHKAGTQQPQSSAAVQHKISGKKQASNLTDGADSEESGSEFGDEDSPPETLFVSQYLKEWTVLDTPRGDLLIEQDFEELYPGRGKGLTSKWISHKAHIIAYARRDLPKSDETTNQILKDIDMCSDEDKQDILVFLLLPSILRAKKGRGNTSTAIPCPALQRKNFFLHVKAQNGLNKEITNHRRTTAAQGFSAQPLVVVVGPSLTSLTAFYVTFDHVKYKLNSVVKAFDVCFKTYFALDADYPEDSYACWLFIQRYFFEINLKEDRVTDRLKGVISSLKGVANNLKKSKPAAKKV